MMTSSTIARIVPKFGSRTPQQGLDATKRVQYTDKDVVEKMPTISIVGIKVEFFNPGRSLSDDELEKEMERRGYSRLATPYELMSINEADPAFADDHPNGTHWQDDNDNWCFVAFDRYGGDGRRVGVYRRDYDWFAFWWFGAVRE